VACGLYGSEIGSRFVAGLSVQADSGRQPVHSNGYQGGARPGLEAENLGPYRTEIKMAGSRTSVPHIS